MASLAATLGVTSADAATRAPAQVKQVTMVASTTSSLTFTWKPANRATSYLIERGDDLAMVARRAVDTTTETTYTATGLQPGVLACFQVRAVNDAGQAARSYRACQYPIAQQGEHTGARYRVVAYNTCSDACGGWGQRLPHAADLVSAWTPDVVMLEESEPTVVHQMASGIGGMSVAGAKSGKGLLYKSNRFSVAGSGRRAGWIDLGLDPRVDKNRYAVWAELVDHANEDKHVIFVAVHLSPGPDGLDNDAQRRKDATALVAGLARINPDNLPLVVAGDFNSHQGRTWDSPGEIMRGFGLGNAYFHAESWNLSNYNTGAKGQLTPVIGKAWGYHIDQVWSDPARTVVTQWSNGGRLVGSLWDDPLPSDHNPVFAELLVN